MNRSPFPFQDFVRAKHSLRSALCQDDETWVLLTGDTGTGKTALLRELKAELDRARFRVLYFSQARRLGPAGLVKVVGESLRVRTSMCHSVTLDRLVRALAGETQQLLLWLDEAHELSRETLGEARALVESGLEEGRRVKIVLVGLPRLRAELQAHASLWRRIGVREEISGLVFDELEPFLAHHFAGHEKRLSEPGLSALFERAKGAPGLVLPMYRAILAQAGTKGRIELEAVTDAIDRWDLA